MVPLFLNVTVILRSVNKIYCLCEKTINLLEHVQFFKDIFSPFMVFFVFKFVKNTVENNLIQEFIKKE